MKTRATIDDTPCGICEIRSCDDTTGRNWVYNAKILPAESAPWYHHECQGLEENKINTFVRISCASDSG